MVLSRRLPSTLLGLVWVCLLMLALPAAALPVRLPVALGDGTELPSLAPMLEAVSPAVVNIATYTRVEVRNPLLDDPFFRRFFDVPDMQPRYRRTRSAGSGVIVDAARGYIVTNNHVVARADEINITLADGRTLMATLVGSDAQVDLAVLKVAPGELVEARFADSSRLRVGDFVIAIGNPFGLNQTVTSGIVSALGRTGLGLDGYEDFIQTDASINPGNSGGALVNLRGELVGINTAIIAPSGGNVGIGFAIPANLVQVIMAQLIAHGEVQRGHLGLMVQALDSDLAEAFGLDWRQGVVVVDVEPGSPADRAGVQAGDIISGINGQAIRRLVEFNRQAALLMVGDMLTLDVLRSGRQRSFAIAIGAQDFEKLDAGRVHPRLAGVRLQNNRAGAEAERVAGVLVVSVDNSSRAWASGLRAGDVLVAINRQSTANLAEFTAAARGPQQLLLRVYRNGEFGTILLR